MKSNQVNKETELVRYQRRRLQQRKQITAMALVGTMMALLLVLSLVLIGIVSSAATGKKVSVGALSAADGSVTMSARRVDYYGAMNLAETGVRMTVQWMVDQSTLPTSTNSTPFYPDFGSSYFAANSTKDDTNKYRWVPWDNKDDNTTTNGFWVKVYPYISNSYDTQKKFIVESVGVYNGKEQIVRASVRQKSFANYALFVDNVPTYWLSAGNNAFGGPVRINASDEATTGNKINILWRDSSTDPTKDQIFRYKQKDAFVTSANTVNWNYNSPTNPKDPVGTPTLNHVIADGGSVQTGAAKIPMPTSSTVQSDAAYGPTKTAPAASSYYNDIPLLGDLSTIGVALPPSGGIVIQGDVEDMVFSVDPADSTKQYIRVYQMQKLTINGISTDVRLRSTIAVDRTGTGGTTTISTAYTLKKDNSKWVPILNLNQPAAGTVPNGVIYANGNVNGVRGVIADNVTDQNGKNIVQRNSMTIATPNTKTLQIGGSLTYKTLVTDPDDPYEPVGSGDKFKSGMLGIVAKKVQIAQFSQNPEGASGRTTRAVKGESNELRDVKVHATVFAYDTFESENSAGRSPGLIDLMGGYIATNGGTFGYINPDKPGEMLSGFRKSNNYDDRVLDSPPPAFPSTSNDFDVLSFKRVTQTLDGVYSI
jgi:hypothetical protein